MDTAATTSDHAWAANTSISWRILLTAHLRHRPDESDLAGRLHTIARDQGWPTPPPVEHDSDLPRLQRLLIGHATAPVRLGLSGPHLVVAADHARLDGLAMLRVVELLGHGPATSDARGIGARPDPPRAVRSIVRRLHEAAFTPPALIEPPPAAPQDGDRMVSRSVPGTHRTAALVRASAAAARAWGAERGRDVHHVAVAIGASKDTAPGDARLLDRSVLLRLRDVETMDAAAIATALRTSPVQTPPVPAADRPWTPLVARAASSAMRLLGPRLGSTMLVSHLGSVAAPRLAGLTFHPVTAGGTGLALGAVEHDGRTTLALRGRATDWDDNGLEQLLEAVISLL